MLLQALLRAALSRVGTETAGRDLCFTRTFLGRGNGLREIDDGVGEFSQRIQVGIRVEAFSIGFGMKLWGYKRGPTAVREAEMNLARPGL